jgi:ribonucleoside-triphosphate reductase
VAQQTSHSTTRLRLSDEFVQAYADRQPDWGPLGWITYKRTYARWVDRAQTRREEWFETVRRVVEGNISLDPRPRNPAVVAELLAEGEEMYDSIFNFAWLPPGRGLWMSGTEYARKNGDALVNCWLISVKPDSYEEGEPPRVSYPFVFTMDQLMKGGGVGASITLNNVVQFPPVRNPVILHIVCDSHHPNYRELDATFIPQITHTMFRVEDSRRGWTEALRILIDAHWKAKRERPPGRARSWTFSGTSTLCSTTASAPR